MKIFFFETHFEYPTDFITAVYFYGIPRFIALDTQSEKIFVNLLLFHRVDKLVSLYLYIRVHFYLFAYI